MENKLEIGKSYMGIVTNTQPYGLFVRVGKESGLYHKSELKKYYLNPSNYEVGDLVIVRVKGVTEKGYSFETSFAIQLDITPEGSLTVPLGVKRIPKEGLMCCKATRIFLPKSLQEIGERAFRGCDSLEYVEIPKNTTISFDSFYGVDTFTKEYEREKYSQELKAFETEKKDSKTEKSGHESLELQHQRQKSLEKIKKIIKDNPSEQVYVKWKNSNGNVNTARIFRPFKIHDDETISLEANGYIYYVLPENIISFSKEAELPINSEDWFGIFGNDR